MALYVNKELISVTSLQTSLSESDNIKTDVYYMKNRFILKTSSIFKIKRKCLDISNAVPMLKKLPVCLL